MFSPCGFSHALPHHRDYIPYYYQHYPGWEPVSAPTKVESQGPPHFVPWSVDSSANSPSPADYHPWCSHSYPVGYYGFRPQLPHIPPPPSHHSQLDCHGQFPCYVNSYPYMVTHPYYPADQTPHCHSSSGKAHCCECPNHTCNRRDGSVKIEEQKSENDMDKESSSLMQIPNCPYPVVWIPPGYSKDKDINKGFESYLPVRNGCNPMNQGGDGQNSLQAERRNQFPWPIVWMPSDQDAIDYIGKKLDGDDPKPEEKQSSKLKIIPLKFLEDENPGEKLVDSHDKHKTLSHPEIVAEKETRTKIIPVRYAEEINDKKLNTEGKLKDKEEKLLNAFEGKDNVAKKASDLKQSSDAKMSKLPPVCLRVDPFPKKKPNGTSRSPSPTSHNDREKAHKDKIENQHLTRRDPDTMANNQIEIPYVNDKFIVKGEACEEKNQDMQSTSLKEEASKLVDNQLPNKGTRLDTEEVKTEVLKHDKEDTKEAIEKTLCESDERKRHVDNTERITGKQEEKRKILSLSEAATLIQSAYRGYEVRRWQPLEKLRRIIQVRQKAEVAKRQIQEFEASSEGQDSKQKSILCETIMNLLLQLDAIQGLHQSLRDMRKSLARELVDLQEKLDSLGPITTMEHGKTERTNLEPKPMSSNPDEVTNASELTYLDGKASIVPQQSGLVLPSESLFSATSLDNLDPLNVKRNLNPLTETQRDYCPGVSHSMEEDQVSQEVIKPSAEDFVTSFTTENEDKLKKGIGGEAIDTSEEQAGVGIEFSHPMVENDPMDGLISGKSSTLPVEVEGETAEIPTSTSETSESDSDTKKIIFTGNEIDTLGEESQASDIYEKISDTIHDSLHIGDIGNDNIQFTLEELCKKEMATDTAAAALEDLACTDECPSTDGHGSLPIYSDRNIMEDDFQSSKQANEPNVGEAEGIALGKGEDGLVHSGLPMKRAQLEAFELSKGSEILDAMEIEKDAASEANTTSYDGSSTEAGQDRLVVGEQVHSIISLDEPVGDGASGAYGEAIPPITNLDGSIGKPSLETYSPLYSVGGGKPTVAPGINSSMEEKRPAEENEKLREMLERLLEAANTQMGVITNLNERVQDLERKLMQKSKHKPKRITRIKVQSKTV